VTIVRIREINGAHSREREKEGGKRIEKRYRSINQPFIDRKPSSPISSRSSCVLLGKRQRRRKNI
jgi:hypothetical protein